MLLKHWMRNETVSDAEMAERIGDISEFMVRKLRFQARGPSIRVAARIEAITGGKVRSTDLVPVKRQSAPPPRKAATG